MARLPYLVDSLLLILLLGAGCTSTQNVGGPKEGGQTDRRTAYIGTYTRTEGHVDGRADGIYRTAFNLADGRMEEPALISEITNPSFLTFSPISNTLFAVSELARPDEPMGFLHIIDYRGGAYRESQRLPTNGKAPCQVALDSSHQYAAVANYVGGVAMLYHQSGRKWAAVDQFTVPETALRGRESWLHSVNFAPDGKTVAIADKGLDKVWLFTLDRGRHELVPHPQESIDLATGAGPRHAVWSANGDYLYVINELDNTINTIGHDSDRNTFTVKQTISTLPSGYTGQSFCADIHLHQTGRYLYGSNRGHNSIAAFTVDPSTGTLAANGHAPSGGEYPRNFALSPRGDFIFVANQNSSNIVTLKIDPANGRLTATEQSYDVPTPVCIEFVE